jgi:hypothetical protein
MTVSLAMKKATVFHAALMTTELYHRVKDVPQMMATTTMGSQLKVFNVLRLVRVVILQASAQNVKVDSF